MGGVVDLEATGATVRLNIRLVDLDRFDDSRMLRQITERYRSQMPVRISDVQDVMNPDRPFRVLLADGVEHRVEGERVEILSGDGLVERKRMPWADRWARRVSIWWRNLRLR